MNVLSVICIITTVLYLIVILALNQRGNGRALFRGVYSTAVLAVLSALFFVVFESTVADYAAYIPPNENVLRISYAMLMLLLPAQVVIAVVGMLMKKKKPILLLIISAALSVAGIVGVCIYTALSGSIDAGALSSILIFSAVYLPYLLYFAVSALLTGEESVQRILRDVSLYLNLTVAVLSLLIMGAMVYDTLVLIGISGMISFLPFIAVWIAVPIIPMIIEYRFKVNDAIRNGEEVRRISIKNLFKKSK